MSDLRVLMIGPGDPSEYNTGLGIAVHELHKCLSKEVKVIHVQPAVAADISPRKEQHLQRDTFNAEQITRDQVNVSVRSSISTYVYGPGEDKEEKEVRESELKKIWEQFTTDTLKEVESYDFDVIYAHDWPTFQVGVELKKKSGKPLVMHVHSLDVDRLSTVHHSWVYEVEKAGLEAADRILTVSKYSAERITAFYGISKSKIEVVYNGVHKAFQRRNSHKKPPLEPSVLFVGRLSGQKSPFSFLEIAKEVADKHPEAKFILAGSGDQRDNLIEFAANKRIGDKVYFTGFLPQDQLLKVYQQSSVFCMPSKSDPFGMAALEAASAGLPVVLSKQCGVAEVLPGAMTANYDEISGFAKYICALLDEPDLAQVHTSKNQGSIQLLTWKKAANEVLETLTDLAK